MFTPFSTEKTPLGVSVPEVPVHLQGGNPQITRQARRLYVGNLPVGQGLTESIITEFFTSTVVTLGVSTPAPILSTWLSSEGTFCVSRFRVRAQTVCVFMSSARVICVSCLFGRFCFGLSLEV
jgi:hypothetical protein